MADSIPPREGRELFGWNSELYANARPGYPPRVYEILVERCGLAEGCRTIEVGAGSGQATKRLAEMGARPLVAVEPDRGFADALRSLTETSTFSLVPSTTTRVRNVSPPERS